MGQMNNYRKLTLDEISALQANMCSASDWNEVEVVEGFAPCHIKYVRFSENSSTKCSSFFCIVKRPLPFL